MKRISQLMFIVLFSFLGTSIGQAQNLLQDDADRNVKQEAREVAVMWTKELALRPKQTALIEDKLIEFILKENAIIQSKMREEVKTRKLAELELAENLHMHDILTRPQYKLFIKIKKKRAIQSRKNIQK